MAHPFGVVGIFDEPLEKFFGGATVRIAGLSFLVADVEHYRDEDEDYEDDDDASCCWKDSNDHSDFEI